MSRYHLGRCVIPSAPRNVVNGRRWLLERLGPLLGDRHSACEDSVLLLSEALTNAIVHGLGNVVEVDAFIDEGAVRVEVIDAGGGDLPHLLDDPSGEHGRGVPMMRMLSRASGFDHLDDGRLRVWFEVPHGGDSVPGQNEGRRVHVPQQARYDGTHTEPAAPSGDAAHPADH
ncbi:ATP-binding protein [Actinomadura fibrosa]|uniref:ATP-binding protein n=1 Tax=Actinomadura fibrosa TaxID=111802 RepID=A0ABW2XBV0_9ACTN|nr:ATP-binding protein [Actinomadura fibrosa]